MSDNTIPFELPGGGGGSGGIRRLLLGPGLLGLLLIGLGGLVFVWFTLTTYIAADDFGVKQVYLGPSQGVQKGTYGPGLHLVIPGYERMHTFPRDLQVLELNADTTLRDREDYLHGPAIRIQTSEGYQVTVDVSILYRISDPYLVLTEVGAGRLYETKIVQRRADKILRETLGQLNAEDFYSDQVRMQAAENARKALTADVEKFGIEVWAVLVRHYTYDQRYQSAIEARNIQDQTVFRNQAEAVSASREAEKNRVLAEGAANIGVESQRGDTEVRKIAARGNLYYRQQVASGDLLVALAEAEGTKLENSALQQAGASNMVGLEMAEALDGVEVIIVSTTGEGSVNPLNLDQLLEGW